MIIDSAVNIEINSAANIDIIAAAVIDRKAAASIESNNAAIIKLVLLQKLTFIQLQIMILDCYEY